MRCPFDQVIWFFYAILGLLGVRLQTERSRATGYKNFSLIVYELVFFLERELGTYP
jgi:hypothetical protein